MCVATRQQGQQQIAWAHHAPAFYWWGHGISLWWKVTSSSDGPSLQRGSFLLWLFILLTWVFILVTICHAVQLFILCRKGSTNEAFEQTTMPRRSNKFGVVQKDSCGALSFFPPQSRKGSFWLFCFAVLDSSCHRDAFDRFCFGIYVFFGCIVKSAKFYQISYIVSTVAPGQPGSPSQSKHPPSLLLFIVGEAPWGGNTRDTFMLPAGIQWPFSMDLDTSRTFRRSTLFSSESFLFLNKFPPEIYGTNKSTKDSLACYTYHT